MRCVPIIAKYKVNQVRRDPQSSPQTEHEIKTADLYGTRKKVPPLLAPRDFLFLHGRPFGGTGRRLERLGLERGCKTSYGRMLVHVGHRHACETPIFSQF